MSIKQIPLQTLTQPHFPNHWVTSQTNDTCDNTSLFASLPPFFFSLLCQSFGLSFLFVCVYVWTRKQPSYLNTQPQWAAGQPVEAQLWVNFALTLKLAVSVLVLGAAWSTQHRWLSKEEVNGTGKQEVPVLWSTGCLDTKRWIPGETLTHWQITTHWSRIYMLQGVGGGLSCSCAHL